MSMYYHAVKTQIQQDIFPSALSLHCELRAQTFLNLRLDWVPMADAQPDRRGDEVVCHLKDHHFGLNSFQIATVLSLM